MNADTYRQVSSDRTGGRRRPTVGVALTAAAAACAAAWASIPVDGNLGPWAVVTFGLLGLAAGSESWDAVDRMTENVRRIGAGNFDVDFPTDRDDGLGRLAEALDEMTETLRDRDREHEASERRFEAVFDDPKMLVGLLDTDGTLRQVNETAFEYVDADPETVLDEPFPSTPWWADTPTEDVREWIDRAAAGEYVEYDAHLDATDGTRYWVTGTFRPVTNAAGDTVSIVVSAHDATERYERQRDLQRYREYTEDVLDAIDDVFYVLDGDRTLQRWNDSLNAVTGYTDAEIGEMAAAEFFTGDDAERIVSALEDVEARAGEPLEAALLTKSGEEIPYEFVAAPVEAPDGGRVTAGIGRDITERVEYERDLERARHLLEQSQALAQVGAWQVEVRDGEMSGLTMSDEAYRIHGLAPDADLTLEEGFEFVHSDDRPTLRSAIERAIRHGEGYDLEIRLLTADGNERWIHSIADPVREDGEVVAIRGSLQNVTEQKERELALESLHEATRGLLGTETEAAVAELVVQTAEDVIGVPGVGVYLLDDESNHLEPAAFNPGFVERSGGVPPEAPTDSVLWDAFVAGTGTVFDDAGVFGEGVEGGLAVPIGAHGVFVVAGRSSAVDDAVRRLVETLVATTEAALDRLDSEASLRKRDAELAARTRRLQRQMQITDIIRRIDQSLVGAESREEIEAAVCDRIVEADDVAFAWIGAEDADGTGLQPRAWAGDGEGYLDAVALDPDDPGADPAATTARTGMPTVVSNVVGRLEDEAWSERALARDFHSVVSVPLAVGEYVYGVLTVYASEPEVFGDLERAVFEELGENIANSIDAVNTRTALHADVAVELTLRFDDPDALLARIARETGERVEYEGFATHSEDETRVFFSTDGEPDAVRAALSDVVSVRDARLVSESEGRGLYEATVAGEVLAAWLVRHGASPESITADGSGMEAVVEVSRSTGVREFVEQLRDRYPTAELAGRRDVERTTQARRVHVASLLEALTDRQVEVLRTAYFAGFFEWPRASTGEDVAEMLDVSQPTVNRHLRRGQQRLLAQLFEEANAPAGE